MKECTYGKHVMQVQDCTACPQLNDDTRLMLEVCFRGTCAYQLEVNLHFISPHTRSAKILNPSLAIIKACKRTKNENLVHFAICAKHAINRSPKNNCRLQALVMLEHVKVHASKCKSTCPESSKPSSFAKAKLVEHFERLMIDLNGECSI